MRTVRLFIAAILIAAHAQLARGADSEVRAFFYDVVAPNGRHSKLLGTLHGGVALDQFPIAVTEAFDRSRIFLPEFRFDRATVHAVLSGRLIEEQLKQFKFKGEELTPEERAELRDKWGVDRRLAERAKTHDCSLLSFGGPISDGFMDFALLERASRQRKSVRPLDSLKQLEALRKAYPPAECEIRNIMNSISPERFRGLQQDLIDSFKAGVEPTDEAVDEELKSSDANHVSARNDAWLAVVVREASVGSAFIAVGNAHIFGSRGLRRRLQDLGFKVERIP